MRWAAAVAADSGFDRWFIPALRIPIGTTVFEELLFRSVLFALLVRLRDVCVAVIMSSIVFGLWHVAPRGSRPQTARAPSPARSSER